MKVFTFWIHGLEQERSWMTRSSTEAAGKIRDSLSARECAQATRLELVNEAPADSPVVFAKRKPRDAKASEPA